MDELVGKTRRECLLCCTYRHMQDDKGRRKEVIGSLDKMFNHYNDMYNKFRKENSEVKLINAAYTNKKHCLDLAGVCKECDRETDHINRELKLLRI